jgi:hypothetical protein
VVAYVQRVAGRVREIAVLIPEGRALVPPLQDPWPYGLAFAVLQNRRGLLPATVLPAHTEVVVCMMPYRLSL